MAEVMQHGASVTDNKCPSVQTFSWRNAPPRKCRLCRRGIADAEPAVRIGGEWLACSDCVGTSGFTQREDILSVALPRPDARKAAS
jgi:hypothetical protein